MKRNGFFARLGAGVTLIALAAISVVLARSAAAASLTVGFASIPSNSIINLTAEGVSDCVHWGLYTETSVDRKTGVNQSISDVTKLESASGFTYIYQYADNYNGYSWSDGTP